MEILKLVIFIYLSILFLFSLSLHALSITDWVIQLEQPEEKAEATRISFAQQRAQIANQFLQMGFDVKLKSSGDVDMMEAEFLVAGEAVPQAQMQGEQQAIGLQQAEMQLQQAKVAEAQRLQQAGVAGEQWMFEKQDARDLQKLDRAQAAIDQQRLNEQLSLQKEKSFIIFVFDSFWNSKNLVSSTSSDSFLLGQY